MKKKTGKCQHFWELIDKWHRDGNYYYEFYCKNCMEIQVVCDKDISPKQKKG